MHLPPHRTGCIPDVYWDAPLGTSQRGVFVVSLVRGGVQQDACGDVQVIAPTALGGGGTARMGVARKLSA